MKPVIIILIIFFAVRFLRKYFASSLSKKADAQGAKTGPAREPVAPDTEDMVMDPVCGSYVPVSTAVDAMVNGKTEFFCGSECRDKFLKKKK